MIKLSFFGAAREVTGSCHLVEVAGSRLLLDCGMIQGGKERHKRNRKPFPFEVKGIDAVVLSHAHIDHSGRLPMLYRAGYRGPIYCTEPTYELARILLADSGRIHEEDARWTIKRLKKQRKKYDWVEPLFTEEDAEKTLELFRPLPFGKSLDLGPATIRFVPAGHILGAGIVELVSGHGEDRRRLVFSGDLGVDGARLISPPQPVERPDYLLMESTYGNREREQDGDRTESLFDAIDRTARRGGKVIVPSFAVGRTQEILARLNDLVEAGRLAGVPVYVDSPMAVRATSVFEQHPEAYSEAARELLERGDDPLDFDGLSLIKSVDESKELNESDEPAVIISASGMCTAGRVKHHLAHALSDPRSTVIFVGYQANGSLGRLIQSGVTPVRIFGTWHRVAAEIVTIEGFSAHADRTELLRWFEGLGGPPQKTFVVHGEESASLDLAATLGDRFGAEVEVPRLGQTFELA